jgi:hypothetical protein
MRASVGVGLTGARGVFVQEYWTGRRPCYAIANVSDRSFNLNASEWNDGKRGGLLASWTLGPESVLCVEVERPLLDYRGALLAFSIDEDGFLGLLKKPRPPEITGRSSEIVTVDGLNGLGDRDSGILLLQPRLVFQPGETVKLALRVPAGTGNIVFNNDRGEDGLPHVKVIDAVSETLAIDRLDNGFEIVNEDARPSGPREIELTVKIAATRGRKMSSFTGRVAAGHGGGFIFSRGLVVNDTG